MLDYRTLEPYGDAGLTYPVIRTRETQSLAVRFLLCQDNDGDTFGAPLADDRLRGFRPRANGDFADPLGHQPSLRYFQSGHRRAWQHRQRLSVGVAPGGLVNFTKLEGYAQSYPAARSEFLRLCRGLGQYAFVPLLVPEQCGFGGRYFGRAYDPSEILSDSCIETTGNFATISGRCRRGFRRCNFMVSPIGWGRHMQPNRRHALSSKRRFRGRRGAARLVQLCERRSFGRQGRRRPAR